MTPELQELARQAVELPGWRWVCGMVDDYHWRIVRTDEAHTDGRFLLVLDRVVGGQYEGSTGKTLRTWEMSTLPDLSDLATAGILMNMLRPVLYQVWFQRVDQKLSTEDELWCVEVEQRLHLGTFRAPHLGAACALAAVALGGWPEAS